MDKRKRVRGSKQQDRRSGSPRGLGSVELGRKSPGVVSLSPGQPERRVSAVSVKLGVDSSQRCRFV